MVIFRLSDLEAKAAGMPRAYWEEVRAVSTIHGEQVFMMESDYAVLRAKWSPPPPPQTGKMFHAAQSSKVVVGPSAPAPKQLVTPTGQPLQRRCCGQ